MQLFVYETVSALLSVSVSAESKHDIMAMGVSREKLEDKRPASWLMKLRVFNINGCNK